LSHITVYIVYVAYSAGHCSCISNALPTHNDCTTYQLTYQVRPHLSRASSETREAVGPDGPISPWRSPSNLFS